MDLAKMIIELRAELQCLNTAIASIEELARVQNVADSNIRPPSETEPVPPEPDPGNAPPVKRRRGRPRKNEAQDRADATKPGDAGSVQSSDSSTASAA
jgi:hypothetical protein